MLYQIKQTKTTPCEYHAMDYEWVSEAIQLLFANLKNKKYSKINVYADIQLYRLSMIFSNRALRDTLVSVKIYATQCIINALNNLCQRYNFPFQPLAM
jgi:hypothetical protein